jgi:biotin carboxyl carrier protein
MYLIKVNGKSLEVTKNEKGYTVDGKPLECDISVIQKYRFSILINNQSYIAEILNIDTKSKTCTVRVNQNMYEIEIADKYDQLLHQLGFDATSESKINHISAPMPGMVLNLLVEPGQEINKGDPVIVLEAMKMENVLKSHGDGLIKQIKVSTGQAVEKGQILIELE